MMEAVDRLRRARSRCEEALHQVLAALDPEVAESAVGRTAIAALLIEKAVDLLSEQLEPERVRSLLGDVLDKATKQAGS